MAGYKVSYKVLSQQGDALKALAKQVDGYASRVNTIRGKLGEDELLSTVRQNLTKLSQQLGESRVVLNMAGELIGKSVERYGGTEKNVVKKVDSVKAHNRDFYKNPVVVASAGGTVAGGAGAAAATAVQYTDNSTTYNTVNVSTAPAETTTPVTAPVEAAAQPVATPQAEAPVAAVEAAAPAVGSSGSIGGIAAGAAGGGIAAGAAGFFGAQKLREHLGRGGDGAKKKPSAAEAAYEDAQAQLARAIKEANKYQQPAEDAAPSDTTPKFGAPPDET